MKGEEDSHVLSVLYVLHNFSFLEETLLPVFVHFVNKILLLVLTFES